MAARDPQRTQKVLHAGCSIESNPRQEWRLMCEVTSYRNPTGTDVRWKTGCFPILWGWGMCHVLRMAWRESHDQLLTSATDTRVRQCRCATCMSTLQHAFTLKLTSTWHVKLNKYCNHTFFKNYVLKPYPWLHEYKQMGEKGGSPQNGTAWRTLRTKLTSNKQENEQALSQACRRLWNLTLRKRNLFSKQRNPGDFFLIITLTTNICRNRYYQTNDAAIRRNNSGENLNTLSFRCDVNIIPAIMISQSLFLHPSEIFFFFLTDDYETNSIWCLNVWWRKWEESWLHRDGLSSPRVGLWWSLYTLPRCQPWKELYLWKWLGSGFLFGV